MRESLLFQLHSYRLDPEVPKPKYFDEVFTTEHNMVRIYKVREVDMDSRNHRLGEYPPALKEVGRESSALPGLRP